MVSEAAAAGVPVLASRIDGTVGLLGRDYPGYFPVGQTAALARLLWRVETDPEFFRRLCRAIGRRAYRFSPAREKEVMEKAPWRGSRAATPMRSGGFFRPRAGCCPLIGVTCLRMAPASSHPGGPGSARIEWGE